MRRRIFIIGAPLLGLSCASSAKEHIIKLSEEEKTTIAVTIKKKQEELKYEVEILSEKYKTHHTKQKNRPYPGWKPAHHEIMLSNRRKFNKQHKTRKNRNNRKRR